MNVDTNCRSYSSSHVIPYDEDEEKSDEPLPSSEALCQDRLDRIATIFPIAQTTQVLPNHPSLDHSVAEKKHIGLPEIPDVYLCPIRKELMRDPVIIEDGFSYEREAITKWLEEHNTSPVTGKILENHRMDSNIGLKKSIDIFIEKHRLNLPEAESNLPGNVVLENKDLQAGDVLLKHKDDSLINKVIFISNIVHRRSYKPDSLNVDITHAAICTKDGGLITEASGKGLHSRYLPTDDS